MLQPKVTKEHFEKLVDSCAHWLKTSDQMILVLNQRGDPELTAMVYTLIAGVLYANNQIAELKQKLAEVQLAASWTEDQLTGAE